MKKKISVPIIVFFTHLIISMLLSFDYPFFNGLYLGFGVTFLTIWSLTLPIITSCITIINTLLRSKKREKISVLEKISAIIGVIIFLIYLSSAIGILKHFELSYIYLFVIIGTLFMFANQIYNKVKNKSAIL